MAVVEETPTDSTRLKSAKRDANNDITEADE